MEAAPALTPASLTALRRAATVVHALPDLRLRLRHETDTIVEVGRWSGATVDPCAFRRWVATIEPDDHGADLAVDVGVPSGSAVHLDGSYRIAVDEVDVHAFPSTLPPRACRAVAEHDGVGWLRHPSATAGLLHLHHDVLTGITLVQTSTGRDEQVANHPVLDRLVPMLAAEETVRMLAATVRRPA